MKYLFKFYRRKGMPFLIVPSIVTILFACAPLLIPDAPFWGKAGVMTFGVLGFVGYNVRNYLQVKRSEEQNGY
jgi:hypothetical protein